MKDLVKNIGILDFGIRNRKLSFYENIDGLIKEAIVLEKYGFSRIWFTEHHTGSKDDLWSNPEILLPIIAAYTEKIKIGIAGTLITYKTPIEIAGSFKLMNSIFKDRIDLGFAKGKVTEPYRAHFNEPDISDRRNYLLKKASSVINFFSHEQSNLQDGICLPPFGGKAPEFWNLTTSPNGYLDALNLGINCSRSIFFSSSNLDSGKEEITVYKEEYQKRYGKLPQINVVVRGTCQKSDKLCKQVLNTSKIVPSLINNGTMIFGTPVKVYDHLQQIAEYYGVTEIIFIESAETSELRISSFKQISKIFNLKSQDTRAYI